VAWLTPSNERSTSAMDPISTMTTILDYRRDRSFYILWPKYEILRELAMRRRHGSGPLSKQE
jgi:hypothetical protein